MLYPSVGEDRARAEEPAIEDQRFEAGQLLEVLHPSVGEGPATTEA